MADAPQYAIAPIDRCYMLVGLVKAAWEGISGGAGVEEAIAEYFGELRARGRVSQPRRRCRSRSRPSPSSRCSAPAARRHAAVPALEFDVHVTEPGGRQVYAIALSAQVMIEPARRAYDAETREQAGGAVRPARALGHHHAQPRLAPGRRARAGLHRGHHVPGARAGELRHGGGLVQVPLRRCRTARCRWRSTSTAPSTTAATTARLQMSLDPLVVLGGVPPPGRRPGAS